MSDQSQWRQEGEGKHPTLAGNIFDPNSSGINTGSGSGLTGSNTGSGLTSSSEGGLTGSNSGSGLTGGSGSGLTGHNSGSGLTGGSDSGITGHNTGSGLTGSSGSGLTGSNTSSGLTGSSGSGLTGSNSATSGLTGSSATGTAEDGSSSSSGGGIVQSALNLIGLGGASTSNESNPSLGGLSSARQPDIVRDFETAPPTGGAGSERAGFGAAETGDLSSGRSGLNQGSGVTGLTGRDAYERSEGASSTGLGGDYDGVKDRSSGSGLTGASALGAGALGSAGHGSSHDRSTGSTGLDRRDEGVSGNSIGDNSNAGESTQNDTRRAARNVTSDHDSEITDRAAREQVADSSNREADDPRTSGPGQSQEETDSSAHAASLKNNPTADKKAAVRENTSSIPTAGGERLGEKHWGESKIVPDNPKPQSEAGVQSSDNDATTSSNTAANTGGATGPPGSHHGGSGEKEGVVGKIKDKLHIGGSS